jgi:hypothetical protein
LYLFTKLTYIGELVQFVYLESVLEDEMIYSRFIRTTLVVETIV